MNESCYIRMSHVTSNESRYTRVYHRGLSRSHTHTTPFPGCVNEWCNILIYVSCNIMSHMNESCHIWMSHVTSNESRYKRVYPRSLKESCHIWRSQWVIWMRHVTYEWVMSHMTGSCHICMSHVTYEWVMSPVNESCHIWMSHVTYEWVTSHMNESCHLKWVTLHTSLPQRLSLSLTHTTSFSWCVCESCTIFV